MTAAAFAAPENKGAGFEQADSPADGYAHVLTNANQTYLLTDQNGAALCFPWKELFAWKAEDGGVVFAFVMDPDITFVGGAKAANSMLLTDGVAQGRGGVRHLSPNERLDAVPMFATSWNAFGARQGACAVRPARAGVATILKKNVTAPCSALDDCTDAGAAGACNASQLPLLKAEGCAYVVAQGDTAGAILRWMAGR